MPAPSSGMRIGQEHSGAAGTLTVLESFKSISMYCSIIPSAVRFEQGGMMESQIGLKVWALALPAMLAFAGRGSAQGIEKFTVTGEMAKKALIRGEINVATAEKLSQVCVEFARQRKLEVANVILAPSGEIVYT